MNYEHLTSVDARKLLEEYGPNEIAVRSEPFFYKITKLLIAPMNIMLFVAALLSLTLHKIFDVYFIMSMVIINMAMSLWHEKKADNTVKKLKETLTLRVFVLRDEVWNTIDTKFLVPGDVVRLGIGSIVPADAVLLEGKNLTMNESALTGESLPVEKKAGDECYSGTYVASGACIIKVTATGNKTRFGKTLVAIEGVQKRSMLEENILSITKFLMTLSMLSVAILTIVFVVLHKPILEIITLDLSLIIAGIPISLSTVMTLITSIGIYELAQKKIIVRRISSLENLSNVNLLLSDKTGTLTKNMIVIDRIVPANSFSEENITALADAAEGWDGGVIQDSLKSFAKERDFLPSEITIADFVPYDSDRKRSTATVSWNGETWTSSFGAPQIIGELCVMSKTERKDFEEMVDAAAKEGYRTMSVAVAHGTKEEKLLLAGTFFLTDIIRGDAKGVIDFMNERGITTKMVTGDNHAISRRIADELGLTGDALGKDDVRAEKISMWTKDDFARASVFSEVLPIDKYHIVEYAKREGNVVAVTGDGINDIPPVRAADVGIAVSNAVPALKEGADLVLLEDGIASISAAIIEARKIFVRLTGFAVYRISESFRVIFSLLVLGVLFRDFPLEPIHLIILALLNDIPIISLAFNRVELPQGPPVISASKRALQGSLFGGVGIINSLLFFLILHSYLHLSWPVVQTLFFLKLSVSGHLLVLVAHTRRRWYQYLPSRIVLLATFATQLVATAFAYFGFLMTPVSLPFIGFVWLWAFFWMQVSDQMKSRKVEATAAS